MLCTHHFLMTRMTSTGRKVVCCLTVDIAITRYQSINQSIVDYIAHTRKASNALVR